MQWVRKNDHVWRYGRYAVSQNFSMPLYRALYVYEDGREDWLLRLGDFTSLEDAQHFCEVHFAVGAFQ